MVIRERIISFGTNGSLFGILSMNREAPRRDPILIPNAGIVHRIGPHRLHVRIARHLAAQGYPVLRFDLHGLGDSGIAAKDVGYEQQAAEDISAAINVLKADQVGIIGLCSGADNAMRAAQVDERLHRLMLLDPHAYGSVRAKAGRIVEKAMDPDRWRRAATRVVGGGGVMAKPTPIQDTSLNDEEDEADRLPIPKEDFARQLQAVTQRSGKVLIRYTEFVCETLHLVSVAQFSNLPWRALAYHLTRYHCLAAASSIAQGIKKHLG